LVANIQIMGTGINITNVGNIVIATPFKSADVLAIQTIGRAIRLHPSKSMANIYDFFDKI
jgi:superfamily II DNA or RNA helicase